MNWLNNICSCISPQLKTSIIDYLNSSKLNNQVIEQQKCTQQDQEGPIDPADHVYALAKSKSYNFMRLQQNSDEQDQNCFNNNKKNIKETNQEDQEDQQVLDAFWYPVNQKGSIWEHYRNIFQHKLKIFSIILGEQQSSTNFDKVYDSQDQLNLLIYCRLESLVKGKKINSYRFHFTINNFTLNEFKQWQKVMDQKNIIPLLQQNQNKQADPEDKSFTLNKKLFKKLLIINPHQFLTVQKIISNENQQGREKSIKYICFSVKPQNEKNNKYSQGQSYSYGRGKGWLHLFGIQATQQNNNLYFKGFLSLELDVSISPSMLKQPISKQIRVCVQKLICSLRKSDQI